MNKVGLPEPHKYFYSKRDFDDDKAKTLWKFRSCFVGGRACLKAIDESEMFGCVQISLR